MDLMNIDLSAVPSAFKQVIAEDVGDAIKTAKAVHTPFRTVSDAAGLWKEHSGIPEKEKFKAAGNTALVAASFVPGLGAAKAGKATVAAAKAAVPTARAAYKTAKNAKTVYTATRNIRTAKNVRKAAIAEKRAINAQGKWAMDQARVIGRAEDDIRDLKRVRKAAARDAIAGARLTAREGRVLAKNTYRVAKRTRKAVKKYVRVGIAGQGADVAGNKAKQSSVKLKR